MYVEERVRLEHEPHDAAERQEHPERAAPRVRDALPPAAGDLPPELYRRRGPGRRARVRVGRAHEPAVPVDAADQHGATAGQRVQFLPLAHFLATNNHGRRSPAHVTAHLRTARRSRRRPHDDAAIPPCCSLRFCPRVVDTAKPTGVSRVIRTSTRGHLAAIAQRPAVDYTVLGTTVQGGRTSEQ